MKKLHLLGAAFLFEGMPPSGLRLSGVALCVAPLRSGSAAQIAYGPLQSLMRLIVSDIPGHDQ